LARKVYAEFKVSTIPSILAISVALTLLFVGVFVVIIGAPLFFVVLFIAIPLMTIIGVIWGLTRGRRLNSKLRELYEQSVVSGDKIILSRQMDVKLARLNVWVSRYYSSTRGRSRTRTYFSLEEVERLKARELPIQLDEGYTIILGSRFGMYLSLPVYVIDEPEYRNIFGDVLIAIVNPLNLDVKLLRYSPYLSYESDYAMLDVKTDGSKLSGSITLYTSIEPKVRGARVELAFRAPGEGEVRVELAKVDFHDKSKSFTYDFQPINDTVVIFGVSHVASLSCKAIAELLNLERPIVMGEVQEDRELKLRFILDVPLKRDVIVEMPLVVNKM